MCIRVCFAQSKNRYHSRMALRKERIPTWLCNSRMVTDHSRIVPGIVFSFIDEVDTLCKVG